MRAGQGREGGRTVGNGLGEREQDSGFSFRVLKLHAKYLAKSHIQVNPSFWCSAR